MFASESVCQSVSPSFQTGSGVRHVWPTLARNAAIRRSRPPRGWLPNEILMIESGLLLWENGGTDGPAESEIGPSKPLLDCGLRGVVVRLRRINRLWLWHFDIDTQAVFYGW